MWVLLKLYIRISILIIRQKVLGYVENMSAFICPHCKNSSNIFGGNNAESSKDEISRQLDLSCLASIPLTAKICQTSDCGRPIVVSDPDGPEAAGYMQLADSVLSRLDIGK